MPRLIRSLPLLFGFALSGCDLSHADAPRDKSSNPWFESFIYQLASRDDALVHPLPQTVPVDHRVARLGKKLFFSPILSRNGAISCASCHHIGSGGDDERPVPIGIDGKRGTANALSVLNSAFNPRLMWDGSRHSLEEQALLPLLKPNEMGNPSIEAVLRRLNRSPVWRRAFQKTFRGRATQARLQYALAEYQRTLITPNSPFDRFLSGERDALSEDARAGWARFREMGCITCHQGFNLGGQLLQKSGIFKSATPAGPAWAGRFLYTGAPEDRQVMRVPPLRNVAETGPYFHDGSVASLEEAIRIMIESQVGLTADQRDIRLLKAFLLSTSAPLKEWPTWPEQP